MDRQHISSGAPWEAKVGYSRAVRVGNLVFVAGTVAADETGKIVTPGDAEGQARFIFQKIARALEQAGSSLKDVVRTRMFVTDMGLMEAVGRAHKEAVGEARPVSTMVAISALAGGALVEIEADAVVGE